MPHQLSTAVAQWLKCCAADHLGRRFDPGHGGFFSDGGKTQERPCVEISVKDLHVVKINIEPSAAACLTAHVSLASAS